MTFKHTLWNVTKIAGAAATVAFMAFQIGVLQFDGEVKQSQADIISMKFAERSETKKLVDALDGLGHTEPYPYGLNGNVIYFSENRIDKDPVQIMEEYQRIFVEEGINEKMHTTTDLDAQIAILEGDIVPLRVTRDKIVMGGLVPTMDILNEPAEAIDGAPRCSGSDRQSHGSRRDVLRLPLDRNHERQDELQSGDRHLQRREVRLREDVSKGGRRPGRRHLRSDLPPGANV